LQIRRAGEEKAGKEQNRRRLQAIRRSFVTQPTDAAARQQRQVNRELLETGC
jgi:hypothetical protein